MTDLRYESPDTLEDAVAFLAEARDSTKILAGGTDVLVQMHLDLIEPELIVDVKNISELRTIEKVDGCYRIGAAVSGVELMDHADFCQTWPGIMDGVKLIGSLQVRGRASIGGNVCNASPAADSVPALIAAGATAIVLGSNGTREVAVEDIGIGPAKTSLEKDEFIVSFSLPKKMPNSGGAYRRFTPRTEMDIAVVGVGMNITLDDSGVCIHARVALGAVAEKALLVEEAANVLIGTKLDASAVANLSAAVCAACRPIDDKRGTKEYRIKVAGVLARRVAEIALERAQMRGQE
jgi:carbon-monoxide dehydrogenase medium subunit